MPETVRVPPHPALSPQWAEREQAASDFNTIGSCSSIGPCERDWHYSASSRITRYSADLPSNPMPGSSGMVMWPFST